LRDAESEYLNHFSQSPLVFPEIEGVNAGSDCFDVLDRTALRLLGLQFIKKSKRGGPNNTIPKVSVSNDLFLSLFLVKIFFTLKKPPF
jgi:hypothetical protein